MGNSFFEDLRLIREESELTLDDIKSKTMIPKEIISSFEATGLVGHPRFNSVYLHSLAKAYADALGISRSEVKLAVNETLSGSYRGRLAAEYLGLELEDELPATPLLVDNAQTPEDTGKKEIIDLRDEALKKDVVPDAQPEHSKTKPVATSITEASGPSPSKSNNSRRKKRGKSYSSSRKSKNGIYLGAGILAVVAALATIMWFTLSSENEPSQELAGIENVNISQEIAAAIAADSLAEIERQKAEEKKRWVLPDTMNLEVVAATDIIQAMEITRDQNEDYPRWVELGDTVAVDAVEKFSLYKGIAGIELYLNGRPVPKEMGQVTRYRIDIERAKVQAYFDSLDAVTQ